MSKACYKVIDGATRKIKKKYKVVDGVTREITKKYVVVNSLTRLCYQNVINISAAVVTLASGTLTYNGSAQTKQVASVVVDGKTLLAGTDYTISGNSATNAGSYTLTITGIGDYEGTVTKTWTIAKAAGTLTLSKTAITLNSDTTSKTVTVTRSGSGAITAESSDTDIATVSVSGTTLTISSVNDTTGTATITVKVAASDNYNAPANKTIAVTASFKPTASTSATSGVSYTSGLSDLSASDVSLFAEAISDNSSITSTTSTVYIDFGSVHRKLSVGDQVSLSLNGTSYAFDIIGFNHDALTTATAYGASTATGKAGITLQMHDLFATTYPMNSSNTNDFGWGGSVMRSTTMGTMKGYLPSAWQSVIKPVNKNTSNGDQSTTIGTISDSCFLLSEIEIFGSKSYSVSGEGSQYAYYKAGNSKKKRKSGSAYYWWERSPRSSNSTSFCLVNSDGDRAAAGASASYGVAFGFCI